MTKKGHTSEFTQMVLDGYENKGYSFRCIYKRMRTSHDAYELEGNRKQI
ncbi:hypothetical protein [Virgibacillus pantothenticus]|nr:hypothetical protein [Virgibacillus pantothenticus]